LRDRQEIIAEVKKQGLVLSGLHFIDYQLNLLHNTAYVISRTRRLMRNLSIEEAVSRFIEEERMRMRESVSETKV